MSYASVQSVIAEAGLLIREQAESLAGVADGTNVTFYTAKHPIADTNFDDLVNNYDVTVYVDDVVVEVTEVEAYTGKITLTAAPAADTAVTIDYAYTSLNSTYVEECIEEAEDWINDELNAVATTPFEEVSPTIRKITRFYAAGLIMSREFGLQSVTEETTKEGKEKIKQAEKWLADHRTRLEKNTTNTAQGDVMTSSGRPRLFQRYDSDGHTIPLADEHFTTNSPY